jgi:hypothetical protein
MASTNGTHGPTGHEADSDIDALYAWHMPQAAPQPCPEAAFSITLRGTLDGIEALLTCRGMTADEFRHNLQQIRGLLDQPQPSTPPAANQGEGWCGKHGLQMTQTTKNGRTWWSHKTADGWCKGK